MKRVDNRFLSLLADHASPPGALTPAETRQLCDLVAERGGPGQRRSRGKLRFLLAAAVVGAGLLAAAAYYNVSDAFRGVLQEQNSAGETAPLSGMAPVVNKSGTLVGETVRDGALEVAVRGIVGDANGFQILVDIADPTGEPLAIRQPDGTLSRDLLRFGGIRMRTEETKDRRSGYAGWYDIDFGDDVFSMGGGDESIHLDAEGGKATMLISVTLEGAQPLMGKTLYLTLRDLKQLAVLPGRGVGMEPDSLYELAAGFSPLSESDLRADGYEQDTATGETTYRYTLTADSEKALPLAPELPGYTVTNAGVLGGALYLRGTAPAPAQGGALFENPQLWNAATGAYLPVLMSGEDDRDGVTTWTLTFDGVDSLESLRGFALVLDAGEGLHTLREGEWEFAVDMDFENTTRTLYPARDFAVAGFTMTAKELRISPYYVSLKAEIDQATFERMMYREHPVKVDWHPIVTGRTSWDEVAEEAVLTMRDGSQVRLPMAGGGGGAEEFSIGFDLPVVIDPEQLTAFAYGDLTVEFS